MYVSIDLEGLRVLHVHPDRDVVGNLLYLEGTKIKHACTDNTDRPGFLDGMTTMELTMFYRNTTSGELPSWMDDLGRRQAIIEAINLMTPRTVNAAELQAQVDIAIEYLEQPIETSHVFRYVPGAKKPAVDDGGLFPLTTPPLSPDRLQQAATAGAQRLAVRAAPSAPAPREPRPTPAPAGPRAAPGGARPVIWAHADEVWEAAGKPTDKTVVLELRKQMMAGLEEKGIKRTTSSTALGDWMKSRIP